MLVRIHRYPSTPLASLLNVAPNFDRLFDNFAGTSHTATARQYPALDVVENDNEFVVVAELPGVAREDVKVSLHDGKLTISGGRKPANLPGNSSSLRTETPKGEFARSIAFPKPVQADAIAAELKDGILKVVLPKVEEVRPRNLNPLMEERMNKTTALSTVYKNGGVPAKRWEKTVTPSADILETPEAFVVLLDIPGAQKETIGVEIDRNMLKVSAPVQRGHREYGVALLHELESTRYHRSFTLGDGVDTGRVDAWFENGVLMLKLFKREEIKPKEIPIRYT